MRLIAYVSQQSLNKMFLSERPVQTKSSLLDQDIDISSKARKRASGFTSAAAARGLKQDSDDIFKTLGDVDPEAIKKMEKNFVDEKVGLSFLQNKNRWLIKAKTKAKLK